VVLYNVFLRAGQQAGDPRAAVTLEHVAAHIDHICQVTGSAAHVGIGSDWDGGFGQADIPEGLEDISDLALIAGALAERGYSADEVAAVMGINWLNLLRRVLH
jgi:membrane dipeptidase